jgi:hypothetical protein
MEHTTKTQVTTAAVGSGTAVNVAEFAQFFSGQEFSVSII